MIVIYHCYGGTHSSVLAAAVHTGLLQPDRIRSVSEIAQLPHFDARDGKDYGKHADYGMDEKGNRILILGRRGFSEAPEFVFRHLQHIYGGDGNYKLVNSARTLNWRMKLGGYISRGLGLKRIGLPLVLRGAQLSLPRISALVRAVKEEV